MFSRRQRTALLASGALLAGLLTPFAVAAPAYAAPDCDLGGFEIDGDLPVNCPPGVEDWDNVPFATTDTVGTYSAADKDIDDPIGWSSAGETPGKTTFTKVYTYAKVGADDHYYLYVAWDREHDSGTGQYAIELTFAEDRVGPDGAPQPVRDTGGIVSYIETQGGDDPQLGQLCTYDNLAGYPDSVFNGGADCTTNTTGFASTVGTGPDGDFFEVGFDLTVLAGVEPGCPAGEEAATVYMRSITGNSSQGNLKGYVAPLEVVPPSTCGIVVVKKEAFNDFAPTNPDFEYSVVNTDLDGTIKIGETDIDPEVEPGDYSISETTPDAPWQLRDIVCTIEGGDPITIEGDETFPVEEGLITTCVITNQASGVTVTKQTDPGGSTEPFQFQVDGVDWASLVDDESQTYYAVPGSTDTISEVVPEGWQFLNASCTLDGEPVGTSGDASVDVITVAGEVIDCVFDNQQLGTIIVHKVVDPAQAADFDFTSGTLGDFTITTDDTGVGTETFENLVPGSYDVTEPQTLPFDTTDLICEDETGDTTWDLNDWSAAIELAAGETVECTYTNTERGEIFVDKDTIPADYDQDFEFDFNGEQQFTLNDSSDDESDPWTSGLILPGTYTVAETVPAGWDLTSIDCGTVEGDGTTIELEPGQVITCTFVNTATPGSLTLEKSAEGVADGYPWSFDFELYQSETAEGVADVRTVDNSALPDSAVATWDGLAVGETYTLIEADLPFGWTADDIVCTGLEDASDADGFQFVVTPGLELECSVVNTATPAEVLLTKTVTGLAEGAAWSFDFTITPGPDSESDTQTATNEAAAIGWSDLLPGVEYSITEAATPGWVNGEITCIADVPEGGPLDDLDPEVDGFQFLAKPGLVLDCSADNEALPGAITVTKSAKGGDGTFAFTLTPKAGGEAVSDSVTTVDGTGSVEFDGILPGARYSIAETNVPSGWEAGSLSCSVAPVDGGDAVVIDAADFAVAPGDEVACAITNTLRPPMPVTGVNLAAGGGIALLLLLGGGVLFLLRRRRQTAE